MSSCPEDSVLVNARREAWAIASAWLAATIYCCAYYYLFGLIRTNHPLGSHDIRPILGMPSWFFWGVMLPWGLCTLFTIYFAGFVMTEDDLGEDHASDLEKQIHEWDRDA